ncbi:protein IMPAIRED IN BABA-INDUCED STERILITY 1-like [Salvia hispanica]|uniref:protein IMPAIRED IN BABA-INDUCED STERILITY 1-like n=1 Tax=Salvia hispanica TaxID=49212 RepID=UPI0020090B23|nr:protein IMPAIRED IN BABA-INDUCED STERILITY 1-like [Salvia hispanica]XP_047946920.1 protein IMPAIRED IN BABA-INDUCED STERILITY 1-like [Salvia hispanica]
MGCINSKNTQSESPEYRRRHTSTSSRRRRHINGRRRSSAASSLLHSTTSYGPLEGIKEEPEKEEGLEEDEEEVYIKEKGSSRHSSVNRKAALFSFKFGRMTEGEHVAAGWPSWLSAAAGEAIEGMLPLRADSFKRLEKIGQGTYSEVYRARHIESGKTFAVKKVRFDSFQPESVKFMAREIRILRRLDHPNVMKLEGIITSKLSSHIYLVFEYMEHDLSGLVSCPDIKFTDSQIKCYMKQLLSGMEHCHSRGILHRDIKSSNILENNQGVLKIADFGLANFAKPKKQQNLTGRVVTLWYRPPELLLGATNYGEAIDLWSVGCVFAEMFVGRPLLKGRTEVEQLHKIFKLCGTPAEDYWKSSKLPLAHMFKPQQSYESTLQERCREFPKGATSLIETFLSFEPHRRGSASSALSSKYFHTKPYACDPSSLPKYPPNKEIDAKYREDAKRRKSGATCRLPRKIRKSSIDGGSSEESGSGFMRRSGRSSSFQQAEYDTMSQASRMTQESQTSTTKSVPIQPSAFPMHDISRRHHLYANHLESEPQPFSVDKAI